MAKSSLQVVDLDAKKSTKKKAPVFIVKEEKPAVKKKTATPSPKKTTKKAVSKKASTKAKEKSIKKDSDAQVPHTPALAELKVQTAQKDTPFRKREPLGHLLVEKILKEAGFKGGISSNKTILDRYSNDESIFTIRPQVVLQPKSQKDVETAVSVIGKETLRFSSLSLTPRAAGTGLSGGSLTDSIMIDVCTHLHHIYEPIRKNGVVYVTCEPGALWRDVEKRLKTYNVYIPSFPASKDICSIGGAVANNAAGPDSLRFGHTANWVESLNITLFDGKTYTFKPITYGEYKTLIKKNNAHAQILQAVFALLEANEKTILQSKPKTTKNSSGYALADVLDGSVASFKKGKGTLNLVKLVCGSQGTIGILTSVTMRTEPIAQNTELIAVPVFDLESAGKVILKALDYEPINIELFDGLTFDLALKNPEFFRDRLGKLEYYHVLLSMYTTYHVRYMRKTPEFTLLITLQKESHKKSGKSLVEALKKNGGKKARLVVNPVEAEMFWQIRRASYSLSKFEDPNKRPAAFLEDMVVPAKNMPKFFMEIKRLLKKYNVTACVHGHGGDGHLHFYPLLDFENKTTPALVMKMTEEFFATAVKFDGNLCGEHNDGIIRTPHLSKMWSPAMLQLFKDIEHIFDPYDIFNPGKKVNPKFDVKASIRHTNNNTIKRKSKEVSGPF